MYIQVVGFLLKQKYREETFIWVILKLSMNRPCVTPSLPAIQSKQQIKYIRGRVLHWWEGDDGLYRHHPGDNSCWILVQALAAFMTPKHTYTSSFLSDSVIKPTLAFILLSFKLSQKIFPLTWAKFEWQGIPPHPQLRRLQNPDGPEMTAAQHSSYKGITFP